MMFYQRGRIKEAAFLACLLTLYLSSIGRAELSGYAEARGFWLDGVDDRDDVKYITFERVRPTFIHESEGDPDTAITITPELFFQQGRNHPDINEVDDYLTVERFYLDCYFENFDLRIGRQAVNWGSALIWNPTDLFREVFLTDYWAERKGINAAKIYVPLPSDSRLTLIASTGDADGTENRYGLKLGTTWQETDLAVVFMDDTVADRLVWGVDIRGQLEVGYWIEAAWSTPKQADDEGHLEAVFGVDYSFPVRSGLIVSAQYYRDGSGWTDKDDYNWPAQINGQRFNLAKDYASIMASLAWNDELSMALIGIANLDDGTGITTPYVNVLLPYDLQLSLGANLTMGPDGGEFRPGNDPEKLTDDPLLQIVLDEYLPEFPENVYYAWLRWSF